MMRSTKARTAGISPYESKSKVEQLLAPQAILTPAQARRAKFLKFARGAFVFRGETSDLTAITEFLTLLDKEQKYIYTDIVTLVDTFAKSSESIKEVVERRGLSIFLTIAEIHRRIALLNLVETFEAEQAQLVTAFEVLDKKKEGLIKTGEKKEIDYDSVIEDINQLIRELETNRDSITVRVPNPLALTIAFNGANPHSIDIVQSHISEQKSWLYDEPYWDGLATLARDTYAQWDRLRNAVAPQLTVRIANIEKPGSEDKKLIAKYEQSLRALRELKSRVDANYLPPLRRLSISSEVGDEKDEPSEAEAKLKQDVVKFSQDAERESKNLSGATIELSNNASVPACQQFLTALSSSKAVKKSAENYIFRVEDKHSQLSIKGIGLAKAVTNNIKDPARQRSLQESITTANQKLDEVIQKAEAIESKIAEVQRAQFDVLLNMIAELFLEQNLHFLNNLVTFRSRKTVNGVQVPKGFKEIHDVLNNHELSRFERLNRIITIAAGKNTETGCCVSFFRKPTTNIIYQTISRLNVLAADINAFTNLEHLETRINKFKTTLVGVTDSKQRHFVFPEPEAGLSLSPRS